ncbi:PREDICTED: testis-specific Y-encoded protein 1-like isoform X3 [Galeopterus variegatus]|uniref:Testis-specific Y-encoded protein 1-like isoform X3 n=1 Tax=Galeopterus variegatus TaxID=482537 RepID=A0ABM0SG93_GALVR|nr:PREDICTED: testis-specific Y-encoded protein 1-like isoform X3 [Galeopterus variegatus]
MYKCSVASMACLHSKGTLLDLRQIVNHPQMAAVISAQDEDVLSYMTDLQVEELEYSTYGCQMVFCFRKNPYFHNAEIIKEYHLSLTAGYRATFSSKIQWFWDDEVEGPCPTEDTVSLSFFNLLCEHNCPGPDRIAEIIIEDLWLNPLKFYPREEDNLRGNVEEARSSEAED